MWGHFILSKKPPARGGHLKQSFGLNNNPFIRLKTIEKTEKVRYSKRS